jgi:hypothetical protein
MILLTKIRIRAKLYFPYNQNLNHKERKHKFFRKNISYVDEFLMNYDIIRYC